MGFLADLKAGLEAELGPIAQADELKILSYLKQKNISVTEAAITIAEQSLPQTNLFERASHGAIMRALENSKPLIEADLAGLELHGYEWLLAYLKK